MEIEQIITLMAGVVALAIALLAYSRSGQPFTAGGVIDAMEASRTEAQKIREVAHVVVSGVEQMKESGRIDTGTQAFAVAMAHLKEWFPSIEADRLVPFIEDAYRNVKLAKQAYDQMHQGNE